MYKRKFQAYLLQKAKEYPILTLIGPRQSGKSTLCRNAFPHYNYVNLEEIDVRTFAIQDPRSFLKQYPAPVIIDEIQRAPDLLSYIQVRVDENPQDSYILTGSQQLLLMEKVTQSLAGRTFIAKLLPFSHQELLQKEETANQDLDTFLYKGGYPRIYDKDLNANEWLSQYFQTYVERDVRQILNVENLALFERFIRLCAGRIGQLLDLSSLANDCGISSPTANAWLSVLKTSFICFTLQPHFKNFNKRLIKSSKLYFWDSGLACYLLQIKNSEQLAQHPLRGNLFENWVITEKYKESYFSGQEPSYYFWRDQKGHEVDLVEDRSTFLYPMEIKSGATFHADFLKNISYLNDLQGSSVPEDQRGGCIYGGDLSFEFKQHPVVSWKEI